MAQKLNNVKISLRRDTLANWNSLSNQILLPGEVAIVTENGEENLKIGNGLSSFAQLPYLFQYNLKTDKVTTDTITARSIAQGYTVKATPTSLAAGALLEADGNFDTVIGIEAHASEGEDYAFVFNGVNFPQISQRYYSHGEGTFNVNPRDGMLGFYIGDVSLSSILSSYITDHQSLSDYYKKSETSSSIELNEEFTSVENRIDKKVYFDNISSSGYNDLSILKIANDDYRKLVAEGKCLSNVLYIVSSDFEDFYGKVLSNVTMTDDPAESEAATKHYVDQLSSGMTLQLSAYGKTIDYVSADKKLYLKNGTNVLGTVDCSDFIKDGMLSSVELCGNMLVFKFNTDSGTTPISINLSSFANIYTAGNGLCCENYQFRINPDVVVQQNDLTSYYKKTETSSSSEISNEFKKYQLSGECYLKSETSSSLELSTEFKEHPTHADLLDYCTISKVSDGIWQIGDNTVNTNTETIYYGTTTI